MDVFLIGATGYVGSTVGEHLSQAGHAVVGAARSDLAAQRLKEAGHRPVRADVAEPASLVEPARQADAVLWAGTTNDGATDAAAVSAVLDALAGSAKPFLYISGVWDNGGSKGAPIDESSPRHPIAMTAWRPAVEDRVVGAPGVRGIAIRAGSVHGRGGGFPAMLVRAARETGAAWYVGEGDNHWPMVHVDDLAALFVLALENAQAGSVFIAAEGEAPTTREIAYAASVAAGAGGATRSWPESEARAALGPFVDALLLDQEATSAKARELLGWRTTKPQVLDDLKSGSYAAAA
jgi:nucleoside-diphosphate-sugar epimerase